MDKYVPTQQNKIEEKLQSHATIQQIFWSDHMLHFVSNSCTATLNEEDSLSKYWLLRFGDDGEEKADRIKSSLDSPATQSRLLSVSFQFCASGKDSHSQADLTNPIQQQIF